MENLTVKNFLVIRSASLDVKKINLIIGSQGTGKSVLAKLLYCFKNIENRLISHLSEENSFDAFQQDFLKKFQSIFPSYAWETQAFKITYNIHQYEFILENNGEASLSCSQNFSDDFYLVQSKIKKLIDSFTDSLEKNEDDLDLGRCFKKYAGIKRIHC